VVEDAGRAKPASLSIALGAFPLSFGVTRDSSNAIPVGDPIGGPVHEERAPDPAGPTIPVGAPVAFAAKAGSTLPQPEPELRSEQRPEPEPELTPQRIALLLAGQLLPPLVVLSLITTPLDTREPLGLLGWKAAQLCLVICVGSLIVRALMIGWGAPGKRRARILRLMRPIATISLVLAVQTSVEGSLGSALREAAQIATKIQATSAREGASPVALAGWTVSQGRESSISRKELGGLVVCKARYQATPGRDRFVLTFRPRTREEITFTGGPNQDLVVRIQIPGLGTTRRLEIEDLLRR